MRTFKEESFRQDKDKDFMLKVRNTGVFTGENTDHKGHTKESRG